uniref:Major facilitator superfamily (MFS) profile domain-containing protein n=1 Tax=Timema bartmani TaxID=61472 RepID=A0A7R9I6J9_9NEOP|nr:unnamed protein product [Timema bartmani]
MQEPSIPRPSREHPMTFKQSRAYHPRTFKISRASRPRAVKRARAYRQEQDSDNSDLPNTVILSCNLRLTVKRVLLVDSLEAVNEIKKTNRSFVETMKSVRQQTVPLFKQPHLLHTVICFIMMMSFFGVSYGLYMWLPEMFNTMSKFSELHPEESGSICVAYTKSGNATNNIIYDGFLSKLNETYSSGSSLSAGNHSTEECSSVVNPETFQNTLVVGGVSAVLFLLYGFIIDYIGKRNVLWLTLLGASGSGIALDFVSSSVAVVGFSCLVVSLLFTCISVLSAFIVDIFPTHLRGMAVSLSLMIGRIGIVAGSFVVGTLLEVNCFSTFFLLGGIPLAQPNGGIYIRQVTLCALKARNKGGGKVLGISIF